MKNVSTKESKKDKNITSRISLLEFKTQVDAKLLRHHSADKVLSMLVLEFEVKDEAYAQQTITFVEIISKTISENIKPEEDIFTFDDKNHFLAFFSENKVNEAVLKASNIVSSINQGLKGYIKVNVGLAQYPQNGKTCSDLIKFAIRSIAKSKEKVVRPIPKYIPPKEVQQLAGGKVIDPLSTEKLLRHMTLLINYINSFDRYLSEHSCLVAAGSILLAKELSLPWQEIEKISIAAMLHDIGYTVFPQDLLQKTGKLTDDEWKVIRLHPWIACEQILRPLGVFDKYLPIIQNHHEFINGSGYPKGKKGDNIPIGSQIISIIDAYQAMRVDRPYRKAFPFDHIVDYYIKSAGIKWDKELVTIFLAIIGDASIRDNLASQNINFEITPFKDPL